MAEHKMEDLDFNDPNDEFVRKYTEKLLKKHSNFREYTDEQELIALTTHKRMIIHFYSPTFKKCKQMNLALQEIAARHPKIHFGVIDVQNCPEMCISLKIKVLPFLGFFKDGFFIDQVVGFEKFGNGETLNSELVVKFISENEISKEWSVPHQ